MKELMLAGSTLLLIACAAQSGLAGGIGFSWADTKEAFSKNSAVKYLDIIDFFMIL